MTSKKHITEDAVKDAVANILVGTGDVSVVDTGTEIEVTNLPVLTSRLSYPSLPGTAVRMLRTSGSTGFPLRGGTFFDFDSGKIADMNDDDGGWCFERGEMANVGNAWALVVLFPVPVDLGSVYIINQYGGSNALFYSADSTDGTDGTWVSTTVAGMHSSKTDISPPIEGVMAIGFQLYAEYFWNNFRFGELRLWGANAELVNLSLLDASSASDGDVLTIVGGVPKWQAPV